MRELTHIVLHCTATPATSDIGVAEIHRWHLQRGWSGIGYHFVIRRCGTVEYGRDIEKKGAHVAGFNAHSVGISLAGGVASNGQTPLNNFSDDQLLAARDLVLDLMATYQIPSENVLGHNEAIAQITHGAPKACPVLSMDNFRLLIKEHLVESNGRRLDETWGTDMADEDESENEARIHTVISGDTLWGIANRYNTTIAEIRTANPSISGDLIHPGDIIRV